MPNLKLELTLALLAGMLIGLILGGMFWQPKYLQAQKNYEGAIELVKYLKMARE